jgi:hypothetical protein
MQRNEDYGQTFSKILASHKSQLANKLAFSLHHRMICQVKNGLFARPPKLEPKEAKEESTSASSQSEEASAGSNGSGRQVNTVKKVLHILNSYEQFLSAGLQVAPETVNGARADNRQLLAFVLASKKEFANLPRESIALAIILLNAEKIELNKVKLLEFIGAQLRISRITRLAQLRKSKAYAVLSAHVKQPAAVPAWV